MLEVRRGDDQAMSPRKRKSDAFVEAVLADRPLPQGRIDDPEEVAALRAAIELRAAIRGADVPGDDFVAGLAGTLGRPQRGAIRPGPSRRAFLMGAAAAVAACRGGTFELATKPAPLPRIQARRQNGSIEVFVPPQL